MTAAVISNSSRKAAPQKILIDITCYRRFDVRIQVNHRVLEHSPLFEPNTSLTAGRSLFDDPSRGKRMKSLPIV
jgi:hypothetical protein